MRQVIRIQWSGESNRGPGKALNISYWHPECAAKTYPKAVVRALMGERVDMSHPSWDLRSLEALSAVPAFAPLGLLEKIECEQCREPVGQAPSSNARPHAGWM